MALRAGIRDASVATPGAQPRNATRGAHREEHPDRHGWQRVRRTRRSTSRSRSRGMPARRCTSSPSGRRSGPRTTRGGCVAVEELGRCLSASPTRRRVAPAPPASRRRPDVAHGDVVASIADAASHAGRRPARRRLARPLPVRGANGARGVAQALVRNSPVPVTVVHQARACARAAGDETVDRPPEPAVRSWSMFE